MVVTCDRRIIGYVTKKALQRRRGSACAEDAPVFPTLRPIHPKGSFRENQRLKRVLEVARWSYSRMKWVEIMSSLTLAHAIDVH